MYQYRRTRNPIEDAAMQPATMSNLQPAPVSFDAWEMLCEPQRGQPVAIGASVQYNACMGKQRKKTRLDFAEIARKVVEKAIGEKLNGELLDKTEEPTEPDTRNPAAVALSKLGASKGGKARAKKLSPRKRSQIAKNAAKARWKGC